MQRAHLSERISSIQAINTHSHHLEDGFFENFSLGRLLKDTYLNWCGASFDETSASRERYLNSVRYKSYFVWLQKSLKSLYEIPENLTASSWDAYSAKINEAHRDQNWHKTVLKERCGYQKIILDTYWNPGSDNGDAQLFSPTFRIDPLLFGFDKHALDHDENNVFTLYKKEFDDIDSFIGFIRELIVSRVSGGSVALKNAIAYDRRLDYAKTSKEKANLVFAKGNAESENIKHFQDYVFHDICKLAAQLDIPIQCHTGMGCLDRTNPARMLETIQMHPETKFVLFHGGFPWADEIAGLLHAFANVYIDICWLPILSPTVAQSCLHQLIEIGTADKVCWGCDTWTSEESFGARLAVNHVLEKVLSEKMDDDYLSIDEAACIAENILYRNPKQLYRL